MELILTEKNNPLIEPTDEEKRDLTIAFRAMIDKMATYHPVEEIYLCFRDENGELRPLYDVINYLQNEWERINDGTNS